MREKTKKLTALMLAVLMLCGSLFTVSAAEAGTTGDKEASDAIFETLNLITYEAYKSKYGYVEEDDRDENFWKDWQEQSVTVNGVDYNEENTTAEVRVLEDWAGKECVLTPGDGVISWDVEVPADGWYTVTFEYAPYYNADETIKEEPKADIERILRINGNIPYSEARYLCLQKIWEYEYEGDTRDTAFPLDIVGNENAPESHIVYDWQKYTMRDFYGRYTEELEFWLTAGTTTIALEGVREDLAIASVEVHTVEQLPTYDEIKQMYKDNGYKVASADAVLIEGELPKYSSSLMIYPIYDRSSAITSPQHSSLIKRNTIGGDKWTSPGKWIQYEFTCQSTGLYEIVTRHRQDQLNGMYTSRSIKINGEYPFEEAKNLRFDFNSNWQAGTLTDGYESFQFYFEEGETYVIEFEVTLGNMAEIIRRVDDIIDHLNTDYMEILKLTGNDPDVNRDYGLSRIMPDTVADLGRQAMNLEQTVEYISEMNGIKSDNTATLEQAAVLVERMASDEDEIAANLGSLKEWISSLGTWVSNASAQYVEIDYFVIQPVGSELPQAKDSGWQAFVFEMQKFFQSFFADYNSIGTESSDAGAISVWTSSGRDQAQIIKNIINEGFAKDTGASVDLKLTAGGVLLQSVLAGVGPDVSIDSQSPMEMAIRGAINPLNQFDTFDEVMDRFAEDAIVPLTLYGQTYAVPTSQVTYFMFCRDDILGQLGLDHPETWDDLMAMVPVLQFNNMEIGMATDFSIFLYQQGGEYWRDEGMATNLDSTLALDYFEYMCNMFTQYSLPVQFDGTNRFKTGEMPVLIGGLDMYNTLQIFAPEISGLWSFDQIPGTPVVDAEGNPVIDEETGKQKINRECISFMSGVVMPDGCDDKELAWDFLDWYSDKEFQVKYCNEMVALLGPSAKQAVSNLEAFNELPWTEAEAAILKKAYSETFAFEYYPGDYFITRYTGFAFNSAATQGADPSDEILSYVADINKEITRKRKEFDLMIADEWAAIKEYTGFETTAEWREYWAEERGTTVDDNTCIRDEEDAEYTFKDWMEEKKITADNYNEWLKATRKGSVTISYKEWLEQ